MRHLEDLRPDRSAIRATQLVLDASGHVTREQHSEPPVLEPEDEAQRVRFVQLSYPTPIPRVEEHELDAVQSQPRLVARPDPLDRVARQLFKHGDLTGLTCHAPGSDHPLHLQRIQNRRRAANVVHVRMSQDPGLQAPGAAAFEQGHDPAETRIEPIAARAGIDEYPVVAGRLDGDRIALPHVD